MKKRGWVIIGFMVVFVTLLIPLGGEDGSARQEKWVARYNGPGNGTDHASALAVDSSGNVYVTGYSSASGTYGFATIKYNTNGKRLWGTRYFGPYGYAALATALAVDGSGNVYVTGYGSSDGTSDDYATVKYSPKGKQLWAARYNSFFGRPDKPCALAVDGSGNV
ncbi:MAG: SBBP repeat-containing protein, partial [Candidatus Aminicenantes bacterium]|nr:SBBP repeat-containing protein [Candidatus Aminicenantes bacterium]